MNNTKFQMLVNGKLVTSATSFPVINPATEEVIAEVPDIEPAQIEQVLAGASAGFEVWSGFSLAQRESLILAFKSELEQNKNDIIDILIAETGKPLDNAEYDFGMLIDCLGYFVEEAKRLDQPVIVDPDNRFHHYIQRQPLGVVVGYLAWNFPLLNVGYKLGPALAAGCSVIIKPSQVTPLATLKVAEIAAKVGFPDGVINIITSNNYDVTNPLLTSDITSLFTMIGSTNAGVKAMQTACTSVKHFSVELGGNAPVIVYDDAELEAAANKIVDLKFGNSGQVCVSPNRCFVHESVYDKFLEFAKIRTEQIVLKAGKGEGALMGPVINAKEQTRILGVINSALESGAKLITGGHVPADKPVGYYIEPTILADATIAMTATSCEIFGPVLPVLPFSDTDNVIDMANDCEFGLSAYVFTTNLKRAMTAADKLIAGSVCINEPHYSLQLPHGGLKQSGVGKDCSKYSLQEYLTNKRVSILIKD